VGLVADRKPTVIPFSAACKAGVDETGADKKYILFAGRLVERKGVKYLLDAYNMIEAKIPHRLVIVGEGPERERLMLQAKNYGLAGRVEFTGWVSQEKKEEYFRNCSLFVNPSIIDHRGDTEMLGVVQLEAMAFAKPVVASKVGGIVDTVSDGETGLLVPPGDAKSLAEAMLKVLSHSDWGKKIGAKGKTMLEEKFSWDTIVSQIIQIYEKCD
jgi:glycosyltransferase involved in cell wall biosynthesis